MESMRYPSTALSSAVRTPVPRHLQPIESRLDQLIPGCSVALSRACSQPADLVPYRMRQALNSALTPAGLPGVVAGLLNLPRADHSYTRHVLHADPKGRFAVAALIWAPQQFSPVHAHYTWCAYRVLSGVLSETHYAWDASTERAYAFNSLERGVGQSACGHAGLELIHRLGNAGQSGADPAVSLHVYGIDAERIGTHVNRVLASTQRLG